MEFESINPICSNYLNKPTFYRLQAENFQLCFKKSIINEQFKALKTVKSHVFYYLRSRSITKYLLV